MSPFLQSLVAGTLCLLAGAYLAFRAYRTFAKRTGGSCGGGGCSSCPSGENAAGANVKTLTPLEISPIEGAEKQSRTSLADWADGNAEDWGSRLSSKDVDGFTGRKY